MSGDRRYLRADNVFEPARPGRQGIDLYRSLLLPFIDQQEGQPRQCGQHGWKRAVPLHPLQLRQRILLGFVTAAQPSGRQAQNGQVLFQWAWVSSLLLQEREGFLTTSIESCPAAAAGPDQETADLHASNSAAMLAREADEAAANGADVEIAGLHVSNFARMLAREADEAAAAETDEAAGIQDGLSALMRPSGTC